jgi:ribonucleotide monophosphatase NagD (HAD superfamily)
MFASNADIIYTTEHPVPRFTQGAFVEAFRAIFEKFSGGSLKVDYCGKPFGVDVCGA